MGLVPQSQALQPFPGKLGGTGVMSHGKCSRRRPDACVQPACPLHRISWWRQQQENRQLSWKPSSKQIKDPGKRLQNSSSRWSPIPTSLCHWQGTPSVTLVSLVAPAVAEPS